MRNRRSAMLAAAAAIAFALDTSAREPGGTQSSASDIIRGWPHVSQQAAQRTIERYGEPDAVSDRMLVWHDNGPWKRTIVHRDEAPHNFPRAHTDVIEQTISYRVPADKFDELASFDGSVTADRTRGELSATCDREEMNFLALNLADEVVNGKRGVMEARQFYGQTVTMTEAGRESEYTQKLLFKSRGPAADPDQALAEIEANPVVAPETNETKDRPRRGGGD